MDNNLYWVSALTYATVLGIVLVNDIRINRHPNTSEKSYRIMTSWVILFCLQDAIWGLCENRTISSERIFFISSCVLHMATVLTTYFWLRYVLFFLEDDEKKNRIFLFLDEIFIFFQLILVIANFFTPTIFSIENGVYVTAALRPFTFINQQIVYVGIGIKALVYLMKCRKDERERYFTVFCFAIAPIVLGVLQFIFPYAPFYSLGYFLGCFIIHIFIISKDRELAEKGNILKSISETFYSLHLVDLETNTIERYIESDILKGIVGNEKDAQKMVNRAFLGTVKDEYKDMVLEFVDLSTVSERMKDDNRISCEFVGRFHGWTRLTIISVEKVGDEQKKIMIITQIIDSEKKSRMELLFRSNNDELTGLYNRRAYEDDIEALKKGDIPDNIVFISMDVNELKIVNDTWGHTAGDEMLVGAAECMKKCLGMYGNIYRTGGDEFNAIIYATQNQLKSIITDFEETVERWKGELVDHVAVSSGYAKKSDMLNPTFSDLLILAEKRMYEMKTQFYRKKGVDRRGQKDAHAALCRMYTKIVKINITQDSCQIINIDSEEKAEEMGYSERISEWINNFAKCGLLHPDDINNFLLKTNLEQLSRYFKENNEVFRLVYRRKTDGEYKQFLMEIIKANDYSDDNQSLYLYVKRIEN